MRQGLAALKSLNDPSLWEIFVDGLAVSADGEVQFGREIETRVKAAHRIESALWMLVMSGWMGGVRKLKLTESPLARLDLLAGLAELQELTLTKCTSLTNIDALASLTGLQTLTLTGCTSLTNIDALASLTGLRKLDLSKCESLTNVDRLADLTGLQELDLSQCNSLTNVDGLADLTGLQELRFHGRWVGCNRRAV